MAKEEIVPVAQKYTLTINEASAYFNIGIKKLRHIAEEYAGELSIRNGMPLVALHWEHRFAVACGNQTAPVVGCTYPE